MKTPALVDLNWLEKSPRKHRMGLRDKRIFFFTLSRLLKGGLAIHAALTVMARGTAAKGMKAILFSMRSEIQEGKALSEAMSRYPWVFTACECRLAAAGEASGRLEDILDAAASGLQKDEETRALVRGAVAYPLFILLLGVFTFVFLIFFMIPRLSVLYQDFGQPLPALTLGVVRLSQWARAALLGLTLPAIVFSVMRKKTSRLAGFSWSLPLWEGLIKKRRLAGFSALFALLLDSGISALEALELAAAASPDENGKRELVRAKLSVASGLSLAESLEALSFMDGTAGALIACGEESGRICDALREISGMNAADLESGSKLILKLLEPALILTMGGIIGFVVIAMLFPLVTMSAVVR